MRKNRLTKVVLILAVTTSLMANETVKVDMKSDIVKIMDSKIQAIYKILEDTKNAKIRGDMLDEKIDTTELPVMQGVFTIKKNGKLVEREMSATDPRNGNLYYLNKKNNIIIKKIGADYVVYKTGHTTTKSALVYNESTTTDSSKDISSNINKFSNVKTKKVGVVNEPTLQQVINNLNKTVPKTNGGT